MSHSPQEGIVCLGIKLDCVHQMFIMSGQIFEEAHGSRNSIHLGATKMYHDFRWFEKRLSGVSS